jgi:hypothetical protein
VQLASNLNTIIDKDLSNLFVLRVNRETEQAAFTASLEFAILHRQLEDLPFDGLTGGQAGHHLDLTPEVSAGFLLLIGGLIPGRSRHGIALLDDEEGVLTPGQGGDPDRQAEAQPGERRLDVHLLGRGGDRGEQEGAGQDGNDAGKHGGGWVREVI